MASAWDAILEENDGTATIDVQNWYVVVPSNDNNQLMPISQDEPHLVSCETIIQLHNAQ